MRAPLLLLAFAVLPSIAPAQITASDILARNIAARGGADKLRSVHSLEIRASEAANWGGRGSSVLRIMSPNRFRFDYNWQPLPRAELITFVVGFESDSGWSLSYKKEKPIVNAVSGDQLVVFREQIRNQFDEFLAAPDPNENKIELVGTEFVDGKPCFKLSFTTPSGRVSHSYYDADSFLLVRKDLLFSARNHKQKILTILIGDYRSVDGILFPHSFTAVSALTSAFAAARDLPLALLYFEIKKDKTVSTVESIEINPALDDSIFQIPAPGAAPPRAYPRF